MTAENSEEKISRIFDFIGISEKLKDTKRWLSVKEMVEKETSADHSWNLAMMTFVIFEELNLKIDLLKCVKLALVHDLPEAITGDICAVAIAFGNKTSAEKFEGENAAIREIKQILPKRSGSEISDLWNEYEKGQTEEAKFVRALDKIEAVNHMICHQSLHNHPDFIATYANKLVTDFPALITVWHEVQKLLKPEFKKRGWNWKKEYELPIIEKKDEDNIAKIFDFLAITEKLKETKRFLNTKEMEKKESSADHSWNMALLCFLIAGELVFEIDQLKALKIALVHDLPEALAGDTDFSLIALGIKTKKEKNEQEKTAILEITKTLPTKTGKEILNLWQEYEAHETAEARFVKAMDKIEGISHMHIIGHTCFDHPELIAPYPIPAISKYPELIGVLEELHKRLKIQYREHGWEWKEEYDIKRIEAV